MGFGFIPGIGQILVFLSGAKWFWKILNNWGTIKKIVLDVESVAGGMISRRDPTPSCEETKKLLDAMRILFENELIDIPGVNEADVGRVFANLENNLVCEVKQ